MSVTPQGMVGLPLYYLRLTIADSANFRSLMGAANQAAALAKVALFDSESAPPISVVGYESFVRDGSEGGVHTHFEGAPRLWWVLRTTVDPTQTDAETADTHLNWLGLILADIEARAGTAGYLDLTSYQIQDGPARPTEDIRKTHGDFWQTTIVFNCRSI